MDILGKSIPGRETACAEAFKQLLACSRKCRKASGAAIESKGKGAGDGVRNDMVSAWVGPFRPF